MGKLASRLRRHVDRWLGGPVIHDLRPYSCRLEAIGRRGAELSGEDDDALRRLGLQLRDRARRGETPRELETDAFALAREASRRVLGLHPFDVQMLGALALGDGNVVEMLTGEGKTLAAVLPTYVHALGGHGAHVLTFNDYLARRDAAWMGPVFEFLGLSVAHVQEGMGPEARRRAYAADVTYLTAQEAGFDLLRDLLCGDRGDLVRRAHHFALVDEADSLMIDEARVPLVIAGSRERRDDACYRVAEIVRHLEPRAHFRIEDDGRNVDLTDAGIERAQDLLGCGALHDRENLELLTQLNCALQAATLLERDVDYILRDGRIRLVDEFTGRVVTDRHWPDGLQSALEAKEGLRLRAKGQLLGSITLQHYLRRYPILCGMTGTAQSAARELKEFYGLDVVVIPPNRPCIREDLDDVVFTHREAKTHALVQEIAQTHARGRPVLVGTRSVAESEHLAIALDQAGVLCEVLNAKCDEREARIVARAGAVGAVTISTNMAGRGTDIRLGGPNEEQRDRVVGLGGLYVIGTQRHESRRVDRQLRGRAGRQGDPGTSRLFISLEDELIVRHGIDALIPTKDRPDRQEGPIDNPVVRNEIARAQRIVEGQNFEIRRTLWRYSEPMEDHRGVMEARRRDLLFERNGSRLATTDPELFAARVARVGERALHRAETRATLFHLDACWSEHLARVADLREGIHLVRIGGRDPLGEFLPRAAESFRQMQQEIDGRVRDTLRAATITEDGLDLEREGLRGPSSTWTYLISDDPFRDQLGVQLVGNTGLAAGVALYAGPLLVLWGLLNRRRRRRRRG
jgi:preprotein translocase subunit SecA